MRHLVVSAAILPLAVLCIISPIGGFDHVELHVETNNKHNLFYTGEPVELTISLSGRIESTGKCVLSYRLVDFSGNVLRENLISFAPNEMPLVKEIFALEDGFYWIEVVLECEGKILGSRKTGIGVLPPVEPCHRFGICGPENFELVRRIGLAWARVDFFWKYIEREEGKYDWQRTDKIVEEANKAGVKLLGVLAHAPSWAAKVPANYRPLGEGVHEGWDAFPPKNLDSWRRFVRETVTRYRGRVAAWEIWNEPLPDFLFFRGGTVEDYVQLLKVAYEEIKNIDPDCLVVGLGGTNFLHMWDVFKKGGFPYMDVASIHHYQPGMYPETFYPRAVEHATRVMTKHAMERGENEKKIWLTEIGWPSNLTDFTLAQNWTGLTPEMQAKFLPRSLLLGLSKGIERSFWFTFKDGPDRRNFEHNQGIFSHELTPKPSCISYATLVRIVGNLSYGGKLDLAPRVHALWFEGENGGCVALWTTFSEVRLVAEPTNVRIFDLMGREHAPKIVGGKWRLAISDSVTYLTSENVHDLLLVLQRADLVLPLDLIPLYLFVAFTGFLLFISITRKALFTPVFTRLHLTLGFSFITVFFASLWISRLTSWVLYGFPGTVPPSLSWVPEVVMTILHNPFLLTATGMLFLLVYSVLYCFFCRLLKANLGLSSCLLVVCWSTLSFAAFLPITLLAWRVDEIHLFRLLISSVSVVWAWSTLMVVTGTSKLGASAKKAVGAKLLCDFSLFLPLLLLLLASGGDWFLMFLNCI